MNAGKKLNVTPAGAVRESWPTRESLSNFIKVVSGVIPLLDSVKDSLEESAGSIPQASRQLDNVTKATESATVEILDLLEAMTTRVNSLGERIAGIRAAAAAGEARLGAIDGLMAPLEASHPDVVARWKEFRGAGSGVALPADMDALFGAISADTMSIGMALQVQDITTQQIAGVSHMIESVRMRLAEVLRSINDGEKPPEASAVTGAPPDPNGHFNGEAEYSRSPDRQEHTDEIIESWKRGNHA